MKARAIFDKAMNALGYSAANGRISGRDDMLSRAVTLINLIYADLYYAEGHTAEFRPITNIQDDIELNPRTLNDIMIYGVAGFFAQSEGDADNQQIFMSLYNQKRKTLTRIEQMSDLLPTPEG